MLDIHIKECTHAGCKLQAALAKEKLLSKSERKASLSE